MNASLFIADRNTHIKIVVVALLAAIAVVAVGISANVTTQKLETVTDSTNTLVFNTTPAPDRIDPELAQTALKPI